MASDEPLSSVTAPTPAAASVLPKKPTASLDVFLLHLDRVLKTPAGIDAFLATVCYGARVSAVALHTVAGRQLASVLLLLASPLTPATSLRREKLARSLAADLAKRLRALGSLATHIRTLTRLWGLLPLYVWARTLVKQSLQAQKNGVKRFSVSSLLSWTQLLSCIAYQACENAAVLAQYGVLALSPAAQARAYLWSSRGFLVYVAAELGRLAVAISSAKASIGKSDKKEQAQQRFEIQEMQRSAARYIAFAPMMTHWSLEKGFLGDGSIAFLGSIPAALQMHKLWTQTEA